MRLPAAILLLFLVLSVSAPAQIFWSASSGGFCGPRFTVSGAGNPSFAFSFRAGCEPRPWINRCGPWSGWWPGNYWLGPVNLVAPSSRRLSFNGGPAPTVPDPVAILPAAWVPQ